MHVTLRDAVPLDPQRDEHDPQGLTTKLYCPHAAWLQDSAAGNEELNQRPVRFKVNSDVSKQRTACASVPKCAKCNSVNEKANWQAAPDRMLQMNARTGVTVCGKCQQDKKAQKQCSQNRQSQASQQ